LSRRLITLLVGVGYRRQRELFAVDELEKVEAEIKDVLASLTPICQQMANRAKKDELG
jgi:hypothetical protein